MTEFLIPLKKKSLSSNIEESIEGIDQLLKIEDEITTIFLESLKKNNDRFLIAERISQAFNNYLTKLKEYLDCTDHDIAFWAATLIIHHQVNNSKAEIILLNAIRNEDLNKATTATTILCREKNSKVKAAIAYRLETISMSDKIEGFFKERLSDFE